MTVIKNGQIEASSWLHLTEESLPAHGAVTVSLDRWLKDKGELSTHGDEVGVRLNAADSVEALANDLPSLSLIVLDMATFTDGRAFSQARLLRDRLGYSGEIRARGDFLRDQIFFLNRVGVNVFEFPEETPLDDWLKAFNEFSVTYQSAADSPEPLYRRR
jgi:uncharacterized protein (DUF934 family)